MLELLGDPHLELKAFHIAGTNGKGSVTATLEALLRSRGLRVATYTSPHLIDFRERIRVDGKLIPRDAVVAFIERWTDDAERLGATFFEVTTALAFDWFAGQAVDVAVIETGLGGRLDSTNVITPLVAGVTSIALDHTDMLGETLEEIAAEKAGIFKPGVPAVIGERDAGICAYLAGHAVARGASAISIVAEEIITSDVRIGPGGTQFTVAAGGDRAVIRTPLVGEYQAWNTATAIAMLRAAGEVYDVPLGRCTDALRSVALPGRFDRRGKFIFDVAHNPAGAAALVSTLGRIEFARPLAALVGVLSDKDWRGVIDRLAPVVDEFIFSTPPSALANRRWDPAAAADYARGLGGGATAIALADFGKALQLADDRGRTVLVTGSFHTVGDAMSCLQLSPMAA